MRGWCFFRVDRESIQPTLPLSPSPLSSLSPPISSSHRAILKHRVKHGAVGLADGPQVEAPHLHHVVVLVVGGDVFEEADVVVGVKLFQLQLGAGDGAVDGQGGRQVVVFDEGVGQAHAVGAHGVAAAVVEGGCESKGGGEKGRGW